MNEFKPMLASPADLDALRYPLYASAKLDGIRIMIRDGRVKTRKLLDLPSTHVQRMLGLAALNGLDGEIIVGDPTAHDVYRKTNSAVMARDKEFDFTFFVFDIIEPSYAPFQKRMDIAQQILRAAPSQLVHKEIVQWHEQTSVRHRNELDMFEERCVDAGYEGIITRDPSAPYKFGRSTAKEQIMLKVKRFEDSEAMIVDVIEEMQNNNVAERDALGRTKRSKAKDGLVGKGTMGALKVRDVHGKFAMEFEIGTGFTAADRAATWEKGAVVKYKYFPIGVKDKPRHPVFLGLRDAIDMS